MPSSIEPKKSANMVCQERIRERDYASHRQRLATVKSTIDNGVPYSTTAALGAYSKRQKMVEERNRQIEKENARLVTSMMRIMDKGSRIDNSEPARGVTSSRRRQIEREQERIEAENWKLLQRLEAAKPTYSVDKWEGDHERNVTYASRHSRYPYTSFGNSATNPRGTRASAAGSDYDEEI